MSDLEILVIGIVTSLAFVGYLWLCERVRG